MNNLPIELKFENAVLNGNLKNMKWLKENNCPMAVSDWTFGYAKLNGNQKNIKWLKENLII